MSFQVIFKVFYTWPVTHIVKHCIQHGLGWYVPNQFVHMPFDRIRIGNVEPLQVIGAFQLFLIPFLEQTQNLFLIRTFNGTNRLSNPLVSAKGKFRRVFSL